jgi:hypothetical protein
MPLGHISQVRVGGIAFLFTVIPAPKRVFCPDPNIYMEDVDQHA